MTATTRRTYNGHTISCLKDSLGKRPNSVGEGNFSYRGHGYEIWREYTFPSERSWIAETHDRSFRTYLGSRSEVEAEILDYITERLELRPGPQRYYLTPLND